MSPFSKPKLAPPQDLSEPDFRDLDILNDKYRAEANAFAHQTLGRTWGWYRIKESFDDLVFLELNSIKNFMVKGFWQDDSRKKIIDERIRKSTTFAASSGWVIGREWATKYPDLCAKLKNKDEIDTDDVPADAMVLLGKALWYLYSLFVKIHMVYYDSDYGRPIRNQKEEHFRSTYQSLMKGMFTCFLSGVKSLDQK